jgi:hypothetical protein
MLIITDKTWPIQLNHISYTFVEKRPDFSLCIQMVFDLLQRSGRIFIPFCGAVGLLVT